MKNFIITATYILFASAQLSAQENDPYLWQGYVEGEYVQMGLPSGGVLKSLSVKRGEMVNKGDILFQLEQGREAALKLQAEAGLDQANARLNNLLKGSRDPEIKAIEAKLSQAKSSLELANLTLDRQMELSKSGASSARSLDSAKASFEFSTAQVLEIEAQLEVSKLEARGDEILAARAGVKFASAQIAEADWALWQRQANAPESALVFDTYYRVGEFVPAGRPILSLLPPENIKVRFFVKETDVSSISQGQTVSISCDGCPDNLKANISYISPEAEFTPPVIYSEDVRDKLVFMVEAIPFGTTFNLHPGQPVDVKR